MRTWSIGLVCLGILSGAPAAADQDEFMRSWPAKLADLHRAVVRSDNAAIAAIREQFVAALPGLPAAQQELVTYTIGYADYRLAYARTVQPREAAGYLADAETYLRKVISMRDRFADAHALLASVVAGQIRFAPDNAAALGAESMAAMARAVQLEPNNPRVLFLQALSQYNTPPEWGGSIDAAIATLRQALGQFARQPADLPWPNWGRLDAHAWLGQALSAKGDASGARAEYEQVLRLEPEHVWVKHSLLPALNRTSPARKCP